MRVGDYVEPELVLIGIDADQPRDVIAALAARLQGDPAMRARVEQALWEREEAHTTAWSIGVAVPHTTVAGLTRPVLGIGTTRTPVPFGPEAVPVRLLFLLLSPPEQSQLHIKLLARIARVARRPAFVDHLAEARTPGELLATLEAEEFEP